MLALDFWELYEADLERAASGLRNNAFRLSIEWSRIFPTATDGVEGIDALKPPSLATSGDARRRRCARLLLLDSARQL